MSLIEFFLNEISQLLLFYRENDYTSCVVNFLLVPNGTRSVVPCSLLSWVTNDLDTRSGIASCSQRPSVEDYGVAMLSKDLHVSLCRTLEVLQCSVKHHCEVAFQDCVYSYSKDSSLDKGHQCICATCPEAN